MGGAVTQPPKYPKMRAAHNTCSQCRVTSQQPTCKYPTCSKLASDDALSAMFCQPNCWPACTNQEDKFIPVPVMMVYFGETLQCNGIRVDATVSQGTRILEYTGQVYTQQEHLVKRNRRPNIQHYTAQLDPQGWYFIDATTHGNEARFINHTCKNPNVFLEYTRGSKGDMKYDMDNNAHDIIPVVCRCPHGPAGHLL